MFTLTFDIPGFTSSFRSRGASKTWADGIMLFLASKVASLFKKIKWLDIVSRIKNIQL